MAVLLGTSYGNEDRDGLRIEWARATGRRQGPAARRADGGPASPDHAPGAGSVGPRADRDGAQRGGR